MRAYVRLGLLLLPVVLGSIVFGQVAQADPDVAEGGLDANPCSDAGGSGGPCLGASPTFYNDETTLGEIEECARVDGSGGLDATTDVWVDAYVKGNVPSLERADIRLVFKYQDGNITDLAMADIGCFGNPAVRQNGVYL